jgi:hypothetical protein
MSDDLERTQLYLRRSQRVALDRIAEDSGVTQSELVRRAIDDAYLGRKRASREERLRIARAAAGAWKGRTETGAAYVERLRSGRLARVTKRDR